MPFETVHAARWRLLRTPPLDGATNMALDEALLHRARTSGEWVLRVYSWQRRTLSLGRNQSARDLYDLDALAERGIQVVRRPTGGRAILHDLETTYSVTGPADAAGPLGTCYARINRVLVHGLRALGIDVELSSRSGSTAKPGAQPCFEHPAPGELVHAGRKLAGSAQWRDESAILQHGSILLDGDQSLVAALLREPLPPPPLPATLRGALGRALDIDEVAQALESAVRALEDADASPMGIEEVEADAARRRPTYLSNEWTWRR
jgi:lipoate-protein ligase A